MFYLIYTYRITVIIYIYICAVNMCFYTHTLYIIYAHLKHINKTIYIYTYTNYNIPFSLLVIACMSFHHVCLGNHKPGPGREGSRALLRTEKGIERTKKTMTTMVPFSKIAGERMFIYAIYGCVNLWYSYGPKKQLWNGFISWYISLVIGLIIPFVT